MKHVMIDILVPVLGRPQNVAPLIASIEGATTVGHRTFFIATEGDTDEIAELERVGATYLVYPHPAGRGDFAKKINWAFPQTDAPWVFQAADDLRFHRGWDVQALAVAKKRKASVIGTDDMGNPLVRRGAHSTHTLIKREYIEIFGGTRDDTGLVFCELYDHEFTDNEFVQTAMRRGQWAFSRRSKVEHLHPIWKKSDLDETYTKAFRSSKQDFRLFQQRMRLKTPEARRTRYEENRTARMAARNKRHTRNPPMNVSIIIATHGDGSWAELAQSRPLPSAKAEPAEVLIDHDPKGNRASVRNALAKKATGDYLCFLDGDDELAPGYIRAMQNAYSLNRDGPLLLTPKVAYVVNGRRRAPKFWPETEPWSGNWMVLGTLVPKNLFFRVGGWRVFDEADWNEWDDWELWIRCQKAGAKPVKVPRATYIAHQEPTSRHRNLPNAQKLRWTYEIGHMHYPDRYPVGWKGQR